MKLVELIKDIIEESFGIITKPNQHWLKVKNNSDSFSNVFRKFFIPSLVIIFLSVILGDFIFNSEYGIIIEDSLIKAGRKTLLLVMILFASIMVIYEASRVFRVPLEFEYARKISIYSMVPVVIVTFITGLFPFLDVIGIASFYSLYLVYTALVTIYEIRLQKNFAYIAVVMLGLFVSSLLIALLLSKLTALIIY